MINYCSRLVNLPKGNDSLQLFFFLKNMVAHTQASQISNVYILHLNLFFTH